MKGFVWLVFASAACGSVGARSDAQTGDDGAVVEPPGTLRWVRSLSSLEALGVADGPGGLVVTGAIAAPADLGGGTLTPTGVFDQVIAGINANDGAHIYSVRHGAAGQAQEFGFLHQVDSQGSPLIYGVSYGAIVDLGLGPVSGGGGPGSDGYIGRYGPGAPSWVQRIVGPGEDKIIASALGTGSTIYGAGWFEQTPAFNGAQLTSNGGRDLFLARFNTFTGAVDLTKTYGGPGREEISSAASTGGTLVVAGMFDATLAFGGTALPITTAGALDVWVAKLDASGAGVWAVRFGGAGDDRDPKLAIDAAGDIYVVGSFQNQIGFGAINLVSKGGTDVFVAKLRGTDGSVAWAVSLGSTNNDGVGDIAVGAAGHVAMVGSVGGAIDGGTSLGGVDSLVASFESATGAARWRKVYSTSGDDRASAITYGRNGDVYACVGIAGPFDFGIPIIGAPGPAAALLRIAP
jgi:predicted secreted protein